MAFCLISHLEITYFPVFLPVPLSAAVISTPTAKMSLCLLIAMFFNVVART